MRYLDEIGHRGPRLLIHADLGVVEWADSRPSCDRLAAHLGLELQTVRRRAGDMLDRWNARWESSVRRYDELSVVKLILPWSTPSMRFCTSELKSAQIASALRKRFPHQPIINITGIRRQESASRSRMPVAQPDTRLQRKHAAGWVWNPIIEWQVEEVFDCIRREGLALHEAYTRYGSSRVSCVFCIMGSASDLVAASVCEDNHEVYRAMVDLEARSTFAFQGARWLADVAPHLLPEDLSERVARAKEAALVRRALESSLPSHLLYANGLPAVRPTHSEAQLIAGVRAGVAEAVGLRPRYVTADAVLERYDELLLRRSAPLAAAA